MVRKWNRYHQVILRVTEPMKRYTSHQKVQIKTTMSYHFTPNKMLPTKRTDITKYSRMWSNWNSHVAGGGGPTQMENCLPISYKEIAYKPAIPETCTQKKWKEMAAERLHTNVHSSFYHASHKLEIIQIHQQMNKWANFIYSYNS